MHCGSRAALTRKQMSTHGGHSTHVLDLLELDMKKYKLIQGTLRSVFICYGTMDIRFFI